MKENVAAREINCRNERLINHLLFAVYLTKLTRQYALYTTHYCRIKPSCRRFKLKSKGRLCSPRTRGFSDNYLRRWRTYVSIPFALCLSTRPFSPHLSLSRPFPFAIILIFLFLVSLLPIDPLLIDSLPSSLSIFLLRLSLLLPAALFQALPQRKLYVSSRILPRGGCE